jgi:5-methylcytosine-specific restriction endonuclease McrA
VSLFDSKVDPITHDQLIAWLWGLASAAKNNLAFKNQTSMQVVKKLRSKYYEEIYGRIQFSVESKPLVWDKSKNKCTKCDGYLKGKQYEIHHIRPLLNAGNNELNIWQASCKSCHQDKTTNEQENGQFLNFSDTELSFNNNDAYDRL